MRGREWVKEKKREDAKERQREKGQLSILRHDFSEDTAACCDCWEAAEEEKDLKKG